MHGTFSTHETNKVTQALIYGLPGVLSGGIFSISQFLIWVSQNGAQGVYWDPHMNDDVCRDEILPLPALRSSPALHGWLEEAENFSIDPFVSMQKSQERVLLQSDINDFV